MPISLRDGAGPLSAKTGESDATLPAQPENLLRGALDAEDCMERTGGKSQRGRRFHPARTHNLRLRNDQASRMADNVKLRSI